MHDRIKAVRMALGLTQDEFADGLGLTRGAITNIERHITEPKEKLINLICNVYHVNREYIVDGTGEMFPSKSLGEEISDIAAAAAKQNVEAVRKFFRELGDEFTDAEILFFYEIYKKHFGKAEQPAKIYPFGGKNTAAARSGDRAQAAEVSAQEEEDALSPPDSSDI